MSNKNGLPYKEIIPIKYLGKPVCHVWKMGFHLRDQEAENQRCLQLKRANLHHGFTHHD